MVLKVTVKTLDSQNYEFEADDSWSVQQFKDHIQPTVNVSANEQRLIFCGRVLQDDKKLTEYDCNGKVIHLVRRPPPSLDNSANTSAGVATADSNNNNSGTNLDGSNRESTRFLDESNVLFSAMTLGPDANMNHILRHILTLQQAIYARNSGDGTPVGGSIEPMSLTDIDRHLHNAARLLRITVNTINECMVRIAALPPNNARPQAERSTLETPTSVMTTASSHTDLPRNDDMQTNDINQQDTRSPAAATTAPPTTTVDDINVLLGDDAPRRVERPNMPRQALTTDDLPQSLNRTAPRLVPLTTVLRSRNTNEGAEGNRQSPLSLRRRGETELDRYLTILNYSGDLQNQFQGLARRYRQLTDMSRLGGLIIPQASTSTNEASGEAANATSLESQSQRPNRQAGPVSSTLMDEARILGLYVPRILHHISHLQHALSDFTVDFTRGRLLLCLSNSTRAGRRHPMARRSNPPLPETLNRSNPSAQMNTHDSGLDQPGASSAMPRDLRRPEQTLEGSVTITATAIETTPIFTTTSTANLRPQADTTIVITSEPVQGGTIRIPVSMPIPHGSISVDFSSTPIGGLSAQGVQGIERQSANPGQQQQARTPTQATTSNSTQTATRPIGVISGRIPLPFDYFLPCFSPWASYSAPRLSPRDGEVPSARIHFRTSAPRQQAASTVQPSNVNANATQSNNGTSANVATQVNRNQHATPVPDVGLAEIVTNLIGSIFRPQQADQNPQQGVDSHSNQDPLFNMIPELALNAATQILGGVLGNPTRTQNSTTNNNSVNNQQQAGRQQQTTTSSSGMVMMDIDIDDSSSSQSESRYQDARESHSPVPTVSNPQSAPTRSILNLSPNLSSQPGHSRGSSSTSTSCKYDRQQLVEMMQTHPDWLPIIEADIDVMEENQQVNNNSQPFFSDAYLSSIPRKRRRLLAASPDRVLILQPSSSQAISNLLRRAITSSSSSNIALLDQVLGTISDDSDLQSAYDDYLKSAIETRLRTDYDYCPKKFSNSSKYFK